MSTHALLSPSGAHRTLECLGALAMENIVGKPDTGSAAAREGTAAHELAERYRNQSTDINDYLGDIICVPFDDGSGKIDRIEVDQQMIDAVETYWEYIDSIPHEPEFIEQRVSYEHIVKDGHGLADCIFEGVEKIDGKPVSTLWVVDLKYGFKKVSAWKNPQGMLYASGALRTLAKQLDRKIERVVIVIVQPRIDNISEYSLSVKELKEWETEYVKPRAEKALGLYNATRDARPSPDDEGLFDLCIKPDMFKPGFNICFWCRAKGKCKAQAKKAVGAIIDGFEDLTATKQDDICAVVDEGLKKHPLTMSNEELSAALKLEDFALNFFKDVRARALSLTLEGEDVPGYKPVQSVGNRTWKTDEAESIAAMRTAGLKKADYTIESIITGPQAVEKIKKIKSKNWKKKAETLEGTAIHKPLGKIKLVEASDKLPSVAPVSDQVADLDFLNVSEEIEKVKNGKPDFDASDLDFLNTSTETKPAAGPADLDFLNTSTETKPAAGPADLDFLLD